MPQPRRKKWTEAEERTLIDKYCEMVSDGTLAKMKTREKKYKPIASHVNSIHHVGDPVVYPWEWTWKDVSNKVQNMRHQYSLVKQKIKRGDADHEEFDWVEGLTHWSNFLRYKEVFGDVTVVAPYINGFGEGVEFGHIGQSSGGEYPIGLEFDYNEEGGYNNGDRVYEEDETMGRKKKRKGVKNVERKAWAFVTNQLAQLREMEARFEQREEERERERKRRESVREKQDEEMRKVMERLKEQRNREWEAMENEREDRRRRRDEELVQERKWEERNERRRSEWNARIEEMLSEHRAEMAQFQARVLDEQQNLTSQLLGMVSQWSGHPGGIADNTNGGTSHYLSQMMQNLQHVGGMVDGDAQVEGHNQDDEFIVDG
ncbi:hypothetical protein HanOQP8_Chr15g0581851 [Helianthus annuus]|nr:hypothetical protein HanOQP8_Chr15g0581851 [Helianthus annuus]